MKDCDITNCFLDGMSTHHWGNNFKVIYRLETDIFTEIAKNLGIFSATHKSVTQCAFW